MFKNENVFVMDHPLIQHKLTYLRDKRTGSKQFRELVSEIAMLMCYEATRDLPFGDLERTGKAGIVQQDAVVKLRLCGEKLALLRGIMIQQVNGMRQR